MFSPGSNPESSTLDGHPSLWRRSWSMLAAPLTTLAPPVAAALTKASGLVISMLVGARASKAKEAANLALRSSASSRLAASMRSSAKFLVSR